MIAWYSRERSSFNNEISSSRVIALPPSDAVGLSAMVHSKNGPRNNPVTRTLASIKDAEHRLAFLLLGGRREKKAMSRDSTRIKVFGRVSQRSATHQADGVSGGWRSADPPTPVNMPRIRSLLC